LLAEIYRGGVADVEECLIAYDNRDAEFFERPKQLWSWAKRCTTYLEHFLAYAGTSSIADEIHSHKYG
jgi:hypothetical protein